MVSAHRLLRVAAVFWSGLTTIGARPWCSAANLPNTSIALLAVKKRVGEPGWPANITMTGNFGGCLAKAAGGSHTSASRALNPDFGFGMSTCTSLPDWGICVVLRLFATACSFHSRTEIVLSERSSVEMCG